jgi:hypothetical protein
MEQVEIGIMLPGAEKFDDLNVNPTWKAHVKTHDKVTVAFVKQLSLNKLYVECVCATVGRYIGLSIPKPIIVKVTHDSFSSVPPGEFQLAFGSEDAAYPSFRRYINKDEKLAMAKLIEFSKTLDIGVFDEWIGNWDRNQGNILYDGGMDFSFIDHENAIDPALKFDESAKANIIIDAIYSGQSEFEKYKENRRAQTSIMPQYEKFPFSLISDKTYATAYLNDEEVLNVISFLEKRVSVLDNLLANRLNFKQKELVL